MADKECTVLLDIQDIGAWFLKFRRNGLIINNRDLVCADCIDVDASIYFRTSVQFWSIINGGIQLQDAISRNFVKCTGCLSYIEMLYTRLVTDSITSHSLTTPTSSFSAGNSFNLHRRNASGSESNAELSINMYDPHSHSHSHSQTQTQLQPLKVGYLLKKRDVWNAWRHRYFILYPGKLVYYADQQDAQPKAAVSLLGAEVSTVKKCVINNMEHWYFM